MGFDENMVETFDDTAENEDLPEGIVEDEGESDLDVESLLGDGEEDEQGAEDEQEESKPQGTSGKKQSEPGYVRKRVDEAVQRATAETEARVRASMESAINERIAEVTGPLIERLVEMDAQDLLRKGAVKDIETARELARYRQGSAPAKAAAENQPSQKPRDEQGRFTSAPKEDPATQARIEMLRHQADAIKADGGPDVIAEFMKNPSAKEKVKNGEWDFYDLAKRMQAKQKKRPPSPMRSPNGATTNEAMNPIMSMTDAEFERLEKRVQSGARIREK